MRFDLERGPPIPARAAQVAGVIPDLGEPVGGLFAPVGILASEHRQPGMPDRVPAPLVYRGLEWSEIDEHFARIGAQLDDRPRVNVAIGNRVQEREISPASAFPLTGTV